MRLIDADAFKKYIRDACNEMSHMYKDGGKWAKQITEDFCMDIDEQPTIEPQRWIPCSERLPEEDHWLGGSGKQFSDEVLISVENRDDEDAWVCISQTIDGKWILELPRHCEITAWMPLPVPYRKEGEEELA